MTLTIIIIALVVIAIIIAYSKASRKLQPSGIAERPMDWPPPRRSARGILPEEKEVFARIAEERRSQRIAEDAARIARRPPPVEPVGRRATQPTSQRVERDDAGFLTDLTNPLNPLSPLSPLSVWDDPAPTPSQTPEPPSYEPPAYDPPSSDNSSYDSGYSGSDSSSYDSGSSSSFSD